MEVRITFRSEVYISGENIKEIKDKWMDLPLYSADALEDAHADFVDIVSVERVDDNSYTQINL